MNNKMEALCIFNNFNNNYQQQIYINKYSSIIQGEIKEVTLPHRFEEEKMIC